MTQQQPPPTVVVTDRWRTGADGVNTRDGYDVTVNGVALPCPVVGYDVGEGTDGPVVTLAVAAAAVTVGGKPPVTSPSGRAARVWGGGGDPRG